MAFNIQEFISNIDYNDGLLQTSHFIMEITRPRWHRQGNNSVDLRSLSLLCERASLPGMAFSTQPIQMWGYGMSEQRPVKAEYGELNVSFLCDATAGVVDFFHKWQQNIYNSNGNTRRGAAVNGMEVYEFGYPDDFETIIDLYHFDSAGNTAMKYKVHGAYPKSIADIEVNWGDMDNIMRVNVSFAYNYWVSEFMSSGSQPQTLNGSTYAAKGRPTTTGQNQDNVYGPPPPPRR